MARPLKIAAPTVADSADTPALANAMAVVRAEANMVAVLTGQQVAMVRATAEKLGYQLPGGCTDADLIQRDIGVNMIRGVQACLEVGRGLIVLKEACEHGQFLPRIEALRLNPKVASKFMAAARLFSNAAKSSHLIQAIGSQSKLFELLVLDQDQAEELEFAGQTGELSLDDVASMTVKELRAAVRDLREDFTAAQAVLTRKNERIDKLERDRQRFAKLPHDDALKAMLDAANGVMLDIRGGIHGQLRMAAITIREHCRNHGGDQAAQDVALAGMVGSIAKALADLRQELNLPDVSNAADQKLLGEIAQWDKP